MSFVGVVLSCAAGCDLSVINEKRFMCYITWDERCNPQNPKRKQYKIREDTTTKEAERAKKMKLKQEAELEGHHCQTL